jgi:hypothetical protein
MVGSLPEKRDLIPTGKVKPERESYGHRYSNPMARSGHALARRVIDGIRERVADRGRFWRTERLKAYVGKYRFGNGDSQFLNLV